MAFSPAGPLLAAKSDKPFSYEFILFNTATGKRMPFTSLPRGVTEKLLFSPDGHLIALGGPDRSDTGVRLYETATGQPVADEVRVSWWDLGESSMLFSPDSRHFAVIEFGGVRLWDLAKGASRAPLQLATGPARGMAFSPDSLLLAAATGHEVRIWRLSLAGGAAETVADFGVPTGIRF